MSVPVILYNERRATEAFEAHRAMLLHERHNPSLADNPAWIALRQDAFEQFALAFEALEKDQ